MTDYTKRIKIPHDGDETMELFTSSGELVSTGYVRIVFGGRGPYVEFYKRHMHKESMYLPDDLKWKMDPVNEEKYNLCYYEFRTKQDYVKIYYQINTVEYADYKKHRFYISPFDLYDSDGNVLIKKLRG